MAEQPETPKTGTKAITRAPWDDRSNLPLVDLPPGGLLVYTRQLRQQLTKHRQRIRSLVRTTSDPEQRRLLIELSRELLGVIGTADAVIDHDWP